MTLWDRVVERAAEHHGYITSRDARDLGFDPTQLRLLAARSRLERVGRGVYRVPILPRGEHDDLAEASAWSLGRGVISHESALVLHGLSDVNPSRVHLTVPRDNHPRSAGGDLYRLHRRDMPASDVTEADGIPVTTVFRTIRDALAVGTDPYQLGLAIDRAEAEGLLRRVAADDLRAEVVAAGRQYGHDVPVRVFAGQSARAARSTDPGGQARRSGVRSATAARRRPGHSVHGRAD